jgi:predicted nucleic acid-binding Zn ribbon protein
MRRTKTQRIGEILDEFFERPFVARKLAEGHMPDYWREVVGERIATFTQEVLYVNGVVYVRMASSAARQEVFYRRDELTQRLNERARQDIVKTIIVR